MGQLDESRASYKRFWELYAGSFAQPLQGQGLLHHFVTNRNVTGSYAEAWVREMAKGMLGNRFKISTGTVIRSSDSFRGTATVPQCDLIIWDSSEMPALFEMGEFALVSFFAVRAIIEIKRSARRKEIVNQLKERQRLLPRYGPILGVVVDHPKQLFDKVPCTPDWLTKFTFPGTGFERFDVSQEPPVTNLLINNSPNLEGIMAFIYFLAQVAGHTREMAR